MLQSETEAPFNIMGTRLLAGRLRKALLISTDKSSAAVKTPAQQGQPDCGLQVPRQIRKVDI